MKIGMDRRKFLTVSGMTGAFYALSPIDLLASQDGEKKIFRELLAKLRGSLVESLERSTVVFGHNLYLHSPSVSATYRGIWPDGITDLTKGATAIRKKILFIGSIKKSRKRSISNCTLNSRPYYEKNYLIYLPLPDRLSGSWPKEYLKNTSQ